MNINLLVLFDRPIHKGHPAPHFSSIEFETADGQHLSMDLYFCKQEISDESDYQFSVKTDIGYCDDESNDNDVLFQNMDKICAISKLEMDCQSEKMARPVGILWCTMYTFSEQEKTFMDNDMIKTKIHRTKDCRNFYDFEFSERLLSTCHFREADNIETLTVEFSFRMEVDVSDIDPECVDVLGLAKELAYRELLDGVDSKRISQLDMMITDVTKKEENIVVE